MIKEDTMAKEPWGTLMAVAFREPLNMECLKKVSSSTPMETYTKVNSEIINQTAKVFGRNKKEYFLVSFKMETLKAEKSSIPITVILKAQWLTWKSLAKVVFIASPMEILLKVNFKMTFFAQENIHQRKKTWFMKESLITNPKSMVKVNCYLPELPNMKDNSKMMNLMAKEL